MSALTYLHEINVQRIKQRLLRDGDTKCFYNTEKQKITTKPKIFEGIVAVKALQSKMSRI